MTETRSKRSIVLLSTFALAAMAAMPACGGGGKAKGGGQKGAGAAGAHQQGGGNVAGDKTKGKTEGSVYDGVTCDATTEGLAWCDSATEVAFCAGGEWYLLDCAAPEIGGDVCAEDGETIDCYAADEL
jgi:hypothetical protein